MKNRYLNFLWNPFEKIAGVEALGVGVIGLVVAGVLNYFFQWHYHGLLHFGPASNPALWCFMAEQLVVWLIPATVFYLGSLLLSATKLRVIDFYGTVAFALLPYVIMNFLFYLPMNDVVRTLDPNLPALELAQTPGLIGAAVISLFSLIFVVWALIWLFKALKVSSNLKRYKLWLLYIVGIVGGDIICRIIIRLFY